MRRRATGRRDGSLVDDDDVAPAALGEVVRGGGTDDPGADDDERCLARHRRLGVDLVHGLLRVDDGIAAAGPSSSGAG
jgi:hypothetical protein